MLFQRKKSYLYLKEEAGSGLQDEIVNIVLNNIDEMLKLNENT